MDLWIRSQDREKLIPINDEINIWCGYIACEFTANIEYKGKVLATYSSKERALEVLDEITHYIDGTIYDMKNRTCVFYNMPKE